MIIQINGKLYNYCYGVLTDADPNANYALQRIEDLKSLEELIPSNKVRDIFVPSIYKYMDSNYTRRINTG